MRTGARTGLRIQTGLGWTLTLGWMAWLGGEAIGSVAQVGAGYPGVMIGSLAGGLAIHAVFKWPWAGRRMHRRFERAAVACLLMGAGLCGGHAVTGFVAKRLAAPTASEARRGPYDEAGLRRIEGNATRIAQRALAQDVEDIAARSAIKPPPVVASAFFDGRKREAFSDFSNTDVFPILLSTAYVESLRPEETRAVIGHELWHVIIHPEAAFAAGRREVVIGTAMLLAFLGGLAMVALGRDCAWRARAGLAWGILLAGVVFAGLAWDAAAWRHEELNADAFGARLANPIAMGGALTVIYSACEARTDPDVHGRGILDHHPDWEERMRALGLEPGRACGRGGMAPEVALRNGTAGQALHLGERQVRQAVVGRILEAR